MTIVQPASSGARTEIPPIISVDDHIVEPPHLWQEWLPARYRDRGPRVERRRLGEMKWVGGAKMYEYELDTPDAPPAVAASLSFNNAIASMSDFLFSGVLVRFPELTLAYSEGQIGWIPYILERADDVWKEHRAWGGVADTIPEPPSTYYYRQIYGCFFRDNHGLRSLDEVGVDNITFETDYPHTDTTWPHTKQVAEEMMGHLPADVVWKIVRGNAARMLSLDIEPCPTV